MQPLVQDQPIGLSDGAGEWLGVFFGCSKLRQVAYIICFSLIEEIHGKIRTCYMNIYEPKLDFHMDSIRISMYFYGFLWISMDFVPKLWISSLDSSGSARSNLRPPWEMALCRVEPLEPLGVEGPGTAEGTHDFLYHALSLVKNKKEINKCIYIYI